MLATNQPAPIDDMETHGRRSGRRPRAFFGALLGALGVVAALVGAAGPGGADSGLPVPRFVSLRSDEVNLRSGPGTGYPIEWVYVRRRLPVEVIAEFDPWRRIRDWQGTVGWVHQSMLDGRRTVVVTGGIRDLRREGGQESAPVARLEAGVIGDLLECAAQWCRIEAGGYRGWLKREEFWGAYPDETID